MAVEVATDLLGKIVEIYGWHDGARMLRARGIVRAVHHDRLGLIATIEHVGDRISLSGKADMIGGLESFPIDDEYLVREVVQCGLCCQWKHPSECATRQYPSGPVRYVCSGFQCQEDNAREP